MTFSMPRCFASFLAVSTASHLSFSCAKGMPLCDSTSQSSAREITWIFSVWCSIDSTFFQNIALALTIGCRNSRWRVLPASQCAQAGNGRLSVGAFSLSARQRAMPRWEKSRQTPARLLAVSIAEVDALLTPYLYFTCERSSCGSLRPGIVWCAPLADRGR